MRRSYSPLQNTQEGGGTDLILKYIELIDIIMGGFEIII